MTNRTAAISIRVRPDLKEKLIGLAEADHRTLAAYIEVVLVKHVEDIEGSREEKEKR